MRLIQRNQNAAIHDLNRVRPWLSRRRLPPEKLGLKLSRIWAPRDHLRFGISDWRDDSLDRTANRIEARKSGPFECQLKP